MRIAVFIPGFQKDESDWCIPAFTNLTRELSRHAEIDVFALRHPPVRATYNVGAVRVHAIGPVTFGRLRIPIVSLARVWSRTLRHFDREHRKLPFDAILSIWATESGALACRAGQRWGVPVLVHVAGGELVWLPKITYGNWSRGLAGALVAISLANADLITIPSSYVRNLLTKKHPSAVSRATCWSLGVDTSMFSPQSSVAQQHRGPFTFIAVASLLPVKGLETLIEAVALVRKELPEVTFRVVIVGDGPLRRNLRAKIDHFGLRGYVVLLGEVDHGTIPAVFATASCFVMTSWHEAQCMALLEAGATGLPWIAYPVGVASDLAKSEQPAGVILQDRKASTLAAAMRSMLERTPEDVASMGVVARESVLINYDLTQQSLKLFSLIESLTASTMPDRIRATTPKHVTMDVLLLMRHCLVSGLRNIVH